MGFTVVMKTLDLNFAVTSSRFNDANDLSAFVTQKGIRVFDAVTGFRQTMLTDPHRRKLWLLPPVGGIHARQSQVMVAMIAMGHTTRRAPK